MSEPRPLHRLFALSWIDFFQGTAITLLYELLKAYSEDTDMAENLQEFVRQSIDKLLESLPAEELRKRLSPEERLEGLPAEERLKGLSAEEVVGALSPEVLEALARQLKANGPSAKPQ